MSIYSTKNIQNIFRGIYGYNDLYKWFLNYIERFKDKSEFYEYCSNIQNTIINHIKNDNNFKFFNSMDMKKFKIDIDSNGFWNNTYVRTMKDFYKSENADKTWLSIDLTKANIQALQYVDVISENSFEEFIEKFTIDEYFVKSKYVREIIFGQTNPSRITSVVKYLTLELYFELVKVFINYDCDIYHHSSDEILIDVSNVSDTDRKYICDNISTLTNLKLNKSVFVLRTLRTNLKDFYFKLYISPNQGDVEFKGVPSYLYPMVYKLHHGLKIYPEFDCVFEHETGLLCEFKEYLELI